MLDGENFMEEIVRAKSASRAAYADEFERAQMFVLDPKMQAALDAMGYVLLRFADRDRRRIKRETRKALKRALAGDLPTQPDLVQLYGGPSEAGTDDWWLESGCRSTSASRSRASARGSIDT